MRWGVWSWRCWLSFKAGDPREVNKGRNKVTMEPMPVTQEEPNILEQEGFAYLGPKENDQGGYHDIYISKAWRIM